MVEYLLKLPGMRDPIMEDGTTAFTMALARSDNTMMGILLDSNHESDINPEELLSNAVSADERDREINMSSFLSVLKIEHYVSVGLCSK